jgi:hypothetical protein
MKTIQLRGGPSDGKRMVVPFYSAEVSFVDTKTGSDFVYGPAGQRTNEGLEVWELQWASGPERMRLAPS